MATAAVQIPSSNVILPGSHLVPSTPYPKISSAQQHDPEEVATAWVSRFNELLRGRSPDFSSVFVTESYWRDLLCVTWDFHTLHGPQKIEAVLKSHGQRLQTLSVNIDMSNDVRKPTSTAFDVAGNVKGVQSFLTVETDIGRGNGLIRLVQDAEDGKWKAFTLFTSLQELKGHEELIYERRPTGVAHGAQVGRKNWRERRIAEENFEGNLQPEVLIVGMGQGGLTVAARLKQLGIRSLIIDRNARIGDNWRNRYHQLVLHDPIWYDHMPYLKFPPNWPIFTPKDKLAEWFEIYAKVLELNVWTETTIKESKFDTNDQKWTVTLERRQDGKQQTRVFNPRHIVQATGASGEPAFPSEIKGINDFRGERLVHSSQFTGAKPNGQGKKVVIVGCCNSGHDIAQDYFENKYDVTMIQRSSTLVITSDTLMDVSLKSLYSEEGPTTEDADTINMSFPTSLFKRLATDLTRITTERDAPLLKGLMDAGFKLDNGPDSSGLLMKYLHRGGGYYIDVGASQLIADKKIKIKQGQEITQINAHSISFTDGTELEADEIIFATGYRNMKETARTIFGSALADKVGDVWGYDGEGETRSMWRKSGHPGFWFFGGNLALCRYYSRLLALQIKALEVGLMKYGDV